MRARCRTRPSRTTAAALYLRIVPLSFFADAIDVDEADDGGDAARGRGDRLHRALVGLEKRGVLDQVADAVARQRHFRA